ncbi:MAG: hypothetical protein IJH20_05630 [Bacilli bacterium]|nr:hypothetical protein [Bacilli bacterium]
MYSNNNILDFFKDLFNNNSEQAHIITGIGIGILTFLILLGIAVWIFTTVYRWRLFIKAGKNGWEAIIPFYSGWTLYEISGFPGWMSLIWIGTMLPGVRYLIGHATIALSIVTSLSLCKKFNRKGNYWILVALLPIVGQAIIAFSDDKYDKTKGEQKNMQPIK